MIRGFKAQARKFVTALLKERLDPGRAAAAVFLGIFIGIVPIYGLQTLAAVGVALLFRLNKPLTVAGTFINNPLLQPFIILASVELGCLLRLGSFQPLTLTTLAAMRTHIGKQELFIWVIGSVALGILAGGVGAAITAVVVHRHRKASANSALRERVRFVNGMFAPCALSDRKFVKWKLRLDRIFELLNCSPPKTSDREPSSTWAAATVWLFALRRAMTTSASDWMRPRCTSHHRRPPGARQPERRRVRRRRSPFRTPTRRIDFNSRRPAVFTRR